jgi:twinkle protein
MRYTQLHQPCPKCPSSDAYCEWEDGHGYCFACQYYKNKKEDFLDNDLFTYEYLPHRSLTKRTLEFYGIKTKIDKDGKPIADGFEYPDGCTKVRNLATKDFQWVKAPGVSQVSPDLFGRNKFDPGSHKAVIITEGEYDAATLWQVLNGIPCVSVRSSSSAVSDCGHARSFLASYERIYLGFDGDAAGKAARENVARLFEPDKVYVLDFQRHKDANEYLEAGEADDLRNIFANAQKYLPSQIVVVNSSSIQDILSKQPSVGIPYPFPRLNEMTHGIRQGESVLITAPPGVGKTEFMHAIEYQILKETDHNVGAIFLEEPPSHHLRSLASIELGRPAFVPENLVTDAEITTALHNTLKTDTRLYLYNHFGTDDPMVLLDTIRFLAVAMDVRFFLLDHISMLVSGHGSERDERKTFDFLCTRLEMLVKELNIGLIFVSHVNDMGQTRGSRAMEQLCDIRIDLSRDIKANSNVIEMTIAKMRPPMGKSGPAGSYAFDSFRRKYEPVGAEND